MKKIAFIQWEPKSGNHKIHCTNGQTKKLIVSDYSLGELKREQPRSRTKKAA